jgi:hypothetical protein
LRRALAINARMGIDGSDDADIDEPPSVFRLEPHSIGTFPILRRPETKTPESKSGPSSHDRRLFRSLAHKPRPPNSPPFKAFGWQFNEFLLQFRTESERRIRLMQRLVGPESGSNAAFLH